MQYADNLKIQILLMSKEPEEVYRFIYNGVEYDATSYVHKHPGGISFLDNMKAERKDFTQYFKCLHSQQAEKILKSFPIVSSGEASKDSKQYFQMLEKVQHLYKVRWDYQILLMTLLATTFATGCITNIGVLSVICFGFTQLVLGWMGHSMAHSRDKTLNLVGRIFSSLIGGFCLEWWSPKHNMHHVFTNSQLYDEDIQHEYKVYLYPFLYLKWRFDSFVAAVAAKNYLDVLVIIINYSIIFYFRKNFIYFVVGQLIAGLFSAFVLIGNHEREQRYSEKINISFIEHQIITCRNYTNDSLFWLILMGGMQYQSQHHLFPQIPFYSLPKAAPIIRQELKKLNKSITYGPIIS